MVSAAHQERRHWAWISGGLGGLGLAFASALLENGAAGVALVDCDASAGAEALAKLAGINTSSVVRFETCDVTDVHAVRKSMADCRAAFGGYLNLVVNNAGTSDESDIKDHINLNVISVIEATYCALEIMRDSCNASNCGCIVNIASAAGVFPLEGASVYTASKHAVVGFTRSFTFSSVAPNYVKVCALAPGFTKTPMLDKVIHNSAMQRNAIETVGVLEPSEVADALLSVIDATPSGGVVYISRSTGVWAPFENQMKVWRDAVRSHRKRQRAKL